MLMALVRLLFRSLDTMIRDLDLEPQIKRITQRHKEAQLACMDAQKSEVGIKITIFEYGTFPTNHAM